MLIGAIGCRAQRPEDQVLDLYHQMEKAEQSGDANALIRLWSRETVSNIEKLRDYIRPNPRAHYTASKVFAQGDQAALIGQTGPERFLSMSLVRQDGRWRVKDQVWSDKAFPVDSVYALVPPAAGAFERAGAPWPSLPPGLDAASAARQGWQVRATYDESYLYIRIESPELFPAPGSTVNTPPSGWPVMKIDVSSVGEFVLHASADIGDQATFDQNGRANSHRPFVAYSEWLLRSDQTVFRVSAGMESNPLLKTGDHFFEVRIPLRTLNVTDARGAKITIGDAQWPKSALFTLNVPPYR